MAASRRDSRRRLFPKGNDTGRGFALIESPWTVWEARLEMIIGILGDVVTVTCI